MISACGARSWRCSSLNSMILGSGSSSRLRSRKQTSKPKPPFEETWDCPDLMAGWLLDTNHLSAALKPRSPLRDRIEQACRSGERVGTCVPALCEWEAGIQALER